MKGVYMREGFRGHTLLNDFLFPAFAKELKSRNWLISNRECSHYPDERIKIGSEYNWFAGEELLDIISNHQIQFIWAIFSGFPKSITFNEIMKYELPDHEYAGYWKNPISIQHPLSDMEIAAWDSTYTTIIATDDTFIDLFVNHFPQSQDLQHYINTKR
ncbi:hypothetical protein LJC63_02305 [Ruminococcaceae bacterium OttesenSCG-928-L11]|nr:hypothetical protein [Ruminococcaceae bacterium OttesenSCG-928-L11]